MQGSSKTSLGNTEFPAPDPAAQAHMQQLSELIAAQISQSGGAIPFDRFMELALYAPGLGYYMAGARKLGEAGDFTTAPEISPLFSRCLARQCAQVLSILEGGDILEFGAGSGVMAADILAELEQLGQLPERYLILELSPDLRVRQRETIEQLVPVLLDRVMWLDNLPEADFQGVILGNEVLDAMPVSRFRIQDGETEEQFVSIVDGAFIPHWKQATSTGLGEAVEQLKKATGKLPESYESEINLRLAPWLQAFAGRLSRAAVILVDYGYSRHEYYHPERNQGTLICHYQHRAHPDPFTLVGLQDITANVDFTAVAMAGEATGLQLAGYSTQAHFLLGCGLDQLLSAYDPSDVAQYMDLMQGVKMLTLPAEMGERFKVIGMVKNISQPLIGFSLRDLSDRL